MPQVSLAELENFITGVAAKIRPAALSPECHDPG
jgi:hypothetical protein